MPSPSFRGLRVLTLESRRATEQAALIVKFDGRPVSAPSVREVPLESQHEASAFVDTLISGGFDYAICLTGVGVRALVTIAEQKGVRDAFVLALSSTRVIARGPKPVAVLRELGVAVWMVAPDPNTWHELIDALDARSSAFPFAGARVAVQEYGVSNPGLVDALTERGATVTTVPIYQWALPEDIEPLRAAIDAIDRREIDVLVLTSSIQLAHLWRVARDMGCDAALREGLARVVIASIGPTTSEEIRRHGLVPDLEASRPKMGILITETAASAAAILEQKRPWPERTRRVGALGPE